MKTLLAAALTLTLYGCAHGCDAPDEPFDETYEVTESDAARVEELLGVDRDQISCEDICTHLLTSTSYRYDPTIDQCMWTPNAGLDPEPVPDTILGTVDCTGESRFYCL